MWFLFGIFTALKVGSLLGYFRFVAPWSGSPVAVGKGQCEVRVMKAKGGRVTGVRVGVPCLADFDFTLRRQSVLDSLFVKLGLSVEQTVADATFDDSVYLLSDDFRLGALLRRSESLRGALHDLLHHAGDEHMHVERVRCLRGRLWVDCTPATWGGASLSGPHAAQRVYALLARAADGLDEPIGKVDGPPRDPHALTSVVLLAACSGLCVNGIVQLFRVGVVDDSIVLDRGALMRASVMVGIAFTVMLLGLCAWLLGKTSRAHVVAMEILLTGSLGAVSTSYAVLYDINADQPAIEAKAIDVALLNRREYRCGKRKKNTCYAIQMGGFAEFEPRELTVDGPDYRRFEHASGVRLQVYGGKLGVRYIASIAPLFD